MLSVICLSFFLSVCWPVLRVQLYTESYWSTGSFWYSSPYFCTVSVRAFLTKQVKTFYRSCNYFRAMNAGNVFLRIQNYRSRKVKRFFSSALGASINICLSVCYWKNWYLDSFKLSKATLTGILNGPLLWNFTLTEPQNDPGLTNKIYI